MQKPELNERTESLEAIVQASVDAINAERAARPLRKGRRRGHAPFKGAPALMVSNARTIRQTVKACNAEGRSEKGKAHTASVIKLYGKLAQMGLVKIERHHHRPPRIIFMGVEDVTEPLLKAAGAPTADASLTKAAA